MKSNFLPGQLNAIALETLGMGNITKFDLVLYELKSWLFCTPGLKKSVTEHGTEFVYAVCNYFISKWTDFPCAHLSWAS